MQKPFPTALHWNYFLALEKDLENLSRYIEFCSENYNVFSIELAHLLFAAASETDTIAKCICEIADPKAKCKNINDYRKIILKAEEQEYLFFGEKVKAKNVHRLHSLKVHIPRSNLSFTPWESWENGINPDWWHAYNHVKHERNLYFKDATLRNAIYSLGGLLAINYVYCLFELSRKATHGRITFDPKSVTHHLEPQSTFIRLRPNFYHHISQDIASLSRSIFDVEDRMPNNMP